MIEIWSRRNRSFSEKVAVEVQHICVFPRTDNQLFVSLFSSLHNPNNGDDSDQSLFCVRIQRLLSARTLHHHHTISTLPHQRPSQGPNTSLTQQPTVDIMTHLPINITLPMMISYRYLTQASQGCELLNVWLRGVHGVDTADTDPSTVNTINYNVGLTHCRSSEAVSEARLKNWEQEI